MVKGIEANCRTAPCVLLSGLVGSTSACDERVRSRPSTACSLDLLITGLGASPKVYSSSSQQQQVQDVQQEGQERERQLIGRQHERRQHHRSSRREGGDDGQRWDPRLGRARAGDGGDCARGWARGGERCGQAEAAPLCPQEGRRCKGASCGPVPLQPLSWDALNLAVVPPSMLTSMMGCMHTQDLANLRLSLPANLLEPQGNLEWWHYLDRPDRRFHQPCSELVLTPTLITGACPIRAPTRRGLQCSLLSERRTSTRSPASLPSSGGHSARWVVMRLDPDL